MILLKIAPELFLIGIDGIGILVTIILTQSLLSLIPAHERDSFFNSYDLYKHNNIIVLVTHTHIKEHKSLNNYLAKHRTNKRKKIIQYDIICINYTNTWKFSPKLINTSLMGKYG